MENEKHTWQDVKYGEKHSKTRKKKKRALQDLEYAEKTPKR